ncbi:MAG TPA: hypothetical protein VF239_07845 [Vicinamibacterales bacterium]
MDVLNVAATPPLAGLSADGLNAAAIAEKQSEDARWKQWKAKGRAESVSFRRRLNMIVITLAAITAFAGVTWFAIKF